MKPTKPLPFPQYVSPHATKITPPWLPKLTLCAVSATRWLATRNSTEELRYRIRRFEDDPHSRMSFYELMMLRKETELLTAELLTFLERVVHYQHVDADDKKRKLQLITDDGMSCLFQAQLAHGLDTLCEVLPRLNVIMPRDPTKLMPAFEAEVVVLVWPSKGVVDALIYDTRRIKSAVKVIVWIGFSCDDVSPDSQDDMKFTMAMAERAFFTVHALENTEWVGQVCHVDYFRKDVLHEEHRCASETALWQTMIAHRSRVRVWRRHQRDDHVNEEEEVKHQNIIRYKSETANVDSAIALMKMRELQDAVGLGTGVQRFLTVYAEYRKDMKMAEYSPGMSLVRKALKFMDGKTPCHAPADLILLTAAVFHDDSVDALETEEQKEASRTRSKVLRDLKTRAERRLKEVGKIERTAHELVPMLYKYDDESEPEYNTRKCYECGVYDRLDHAFITCVTCKGVFCSEFCCGQFHTV